MEKNLDKLEAIKKMKELAEDVKFCMLATADSNNNLYGRPMTTMQVEDDGTIWFFTNNENDAAAKAKKDEKVCLNYADPSKTTYLTVQGTAELVVDKEKMKELWNPKLKAWFPDGLEDRNIALLKVIPRQAHYWDVDASKLVVLYAAVKASITGEMADIGEHGELAING
jgi:general stress protein 26